MNALIQRNPFHVLELEPTCSRIEAERHGQKLLGMLELEIEAASRYPSPVGMRERTSEDVRHALAELRDPVRRLQAELWYVRIDAVPADAGGPAIAEPQKAAWTDALALHRWRSG